MGSLRIGMVLADRDSLPDIRVDKEATALLDAGHRVGLLAGGNENLDVGDAAPTGVEVYRSDAPILSILGLTPRPKPRLLVDGLIAGKRDRAFFSRALGFEGLRFLEEGISPSWAVAIRKFIRAFSPDVLHVHDLLALPTALRVACGQRLPVVADLHENWPAYLDAMADPMQGLDRIAFETLWSAERWRRFEEELLPLCAETIVVVPEAARRLIARGVVSSAITVVSNTEPPLTHAPEPIAGYEDRWVALYAGSVDHARGLDVILHAVDTIASAHPSFLLLIVGANPDWRSRLDRLAGSLRVRGHVAVEGWRPRGEIPSYVAASRLCLVPHRDLEHTNTTVPHKLFQYMGQAKPVVVSSCPPLARIVHDTGAGRVFQANSPRSAAEVITEIIDSPDLASSMGAKGVAAVSGPYGWKKDADRLIALYDRVAGRQ